MKEYCKMYYKYVAFFIISINIMLPGCTSVKLNPETSLAAEKTPSIQNTTTPVPSPTPTPPNASGEKALVKALGNRDQETRRAAADALGVIGAGHIQRLSILAVLIAGRTRRRQPLAHRLVRA